MLLLVFLLIWLMRDWGPMLEAERASRSNPRPELPVAAESVTGSRIALALVPLAVLVLGVFGGLYVGGGGLELTLTFPHLVQAMGKADAAAVFVLATAVASLVALGLTAVGRRTPALPDARQGGTQAFFHGMQQMFLPALILVFAWMLNSVIKELGTANYLVTLLGERLPAAWLPALVFVLASIISFSTGTS